MPGDKSESLRKGPEHDYKIELARPVSTENFKDVDVDEVKINLDVFDFLEARDHGASQKQKKKRQSEKPSSLLLVNPGDSSHAIELPVVDPASRQNSTPQDQIIPSSH